MIAVKKIEADEAAGGFWESRVSDGLGVPRKVLARLRKDHLQETTHWLRRENNAVVLTSAGLARIEELLAGEPGEGEDNGKGPANAGKPPPNDVPAGPPMRQKMEVIKVPQNTGILMCKTWEGDQVMVRVRENVNFEAGMMIEAIAGPGGYWQFRNRWDSHESTCGRLPRRKGRW